MASFLIKIYILDPLNTKQDCQLLCCVKHVQIIHNLSFVLKCSLQALKLSCELTVTCRSKLGFYDASSDVQECLVVCSATKQRRGPCEELSTTDSGSVRHAELPSNTDTVRLSVNKKSLTSCLWSHSESKLIYVSFIMVNYHFFCFVLLLLMVLLCIFISGLVKK